MNEYNVSITIDYSDNEERCGKITLSVNDSVLINKKPVSIPKHFRSSFSGTASMIMEVKSITLPVVKNPTLANKLADVGKLIGQNLQKETNYSYLSDSKSQIVLTSVKSDSAQRPEKTMDFFGVAGETGEILNKIIQNLSQHPHQIKISINDSKWQFLPSKYSQETTNVIYKSLQQAIKSCKEAANEQLMNTFISQDANANVNNSREKSKAQAPTVANVFSNPKINKKPLSPTSQVRSSANQKSLHHNHPHYNRDSTSSDINALDALFAYHYPDTYLLFHPTSSYAWVNYLMQNDKTLTTLSSSGSNTAFDANVRKIENELCEVTKDSHVGSCRFIPSDDGYKIELFADADRKQSMGVVDFNQEKGCYTLTGDKACINVETTPQGEVKATLYNPSEPSNVITTSFSPQSDSSHLGGSWSSVDQSTSISLSGKLSLDPQDPYTSTVFTDSGYQDSSSPAKSSINITPEMIPSISSDRGYTDSAPSHFSSNPSSDEFNSPKQDFSPPPPPPPPPPQWDNTDSSYSNSLSM